MPWTQALQNSMDWMREHYLDPRSDRVLGTVLAATGIILLASLRTLF